MRSLAAVIAVAAGCGGSTVAAPEAACPEPPATTRGPAAAPRLRWPALIAARPARSAPPELAQFGRLVGVWRCRSERRQPDGSFTETAGESSWTWFYTLGGRAVQDIYEPPSGAAGTNLRIYDPETDAWEIQWVTGGGARFERITAKVEGETVVLRGEAPATDKYSAHARKVTFFDITGDSFEWKYEATKPGSDAGWTEFQRLHCKKTGADPLAR